MKKALIIVDMQKDFLPGRMDNEFKPALPVPGGDLVIPNIVKEAYSGYDLIVATRDFHPGNHISFKELGGQWPMHCVAGSEGAQIIGEVDMIADVIVSKGQKSYDEQYSGFDTEVLGPMLRILLDVEDDIVIVGVATDYCVHATALGALMYGFKKVSVLLDCVAGVAEETTLSALTDLEEQGVILKTR